MGFTDVTNEFSRQFNFRLKNYIHGTNMEFKNKLDFKLPQMPTNERTVRGVSKASQDAVKQSTHIPGPSALTVLPISLCLFPINTPHNPRTAKEHYVRDKLDGLSRTTNRNTENMGPHGATQTG